MAVNTYSLASDGNEFLSENFTVREFASRDGAVSVERWRSMVTDVFDGYDTICVEGF